MTDTEAPIEVTVSGAGRMRGDQLVADESAQAGCSVCGRSVDLTVTLGSAHVCVDCLRRGLDASSVARYRLGSAGGLPWGKVTS